MKDKIMMFIIGVLVGAVIATGAFYVYTITNNNNNQTTQMNEGGTPPEMPNGQNGELPEKPSGDNMPPEMPNSANQSNS